KPLDPLIVNVYGAGEGSFDLYEDDGVSLAYAQGASAHTPIRHARGGDGLEQLLIGPTQGTFQGQLEERSYELRIHTTDRPSSISVDGRPLSQWTWDADQTTAVATLPRRSIRNRIGVEWR
ncbi:MAG: DUF5110 domain-containing protein, partial [Gammaproteobacteria bacterium]